MRRSVFAGVALAALGGVARADSTLLVSHQMQSIWHGYVVFLDGARRSDASGNAKRLTGVAPGRHELSVNIVSNPFKPNGKPFCTGFIDVPDLSEMRIKCEDNHALTIIGTTTYAPPPPPAPPLPPPPLVAPAPDPRGDADELLAIASRAMSAAPPACVRLRVNVYDLRRELSFRRRGRHGSRRLAFETEQLASTAQDVCPPDAVAALHDAGRALAPYDAGPPPAAPPIANHDQVEGMIGAIGAAPAGPARLVMLRTVTRGSWFETRQVARLLGPLSSSADRLLGLRDLGPRIVDPDRAGPVLELFPPGAERQEALLLLGR